MPTDVIAPVAAMAAVFILFMTGLAYGVIASRAAERRRP